MLPTPRAMEINRNQQRGVVGLLEKEFADLLASLKALVSSVPNELLYRRPPLITIGENIVRSAGVVEQTFGGLTANLWDDPFEWTLPETLSNGQLIVEYINEVDQTRSGAFRFFVDDGSLSKYVATPSGERRPLISVLVDTLVRGSDYRGRAAATLKILSDVGTPGFII
jgi:hypothetical protein